MQEEQSEQTAVSTTGMEPEREDDPEREALKTAFSRFDATSWAAILQYILGIPDQKFAEYLQAHDLGHLLSNDKPIPPETAMIEVADYVQYYLQSHQNEQDPQSQALRNQLAYQVPYLCVVRLDEEINAEMRYRESGSTFRSLIDLLRESYTQAHKCEGFSALQAAARDSISDHLRLEEFLWFHCTLSREQIEPALAALRTYRNQPHFWEAKVRMLVRSQAIRQQLGLGSEQDLQAMVASWFPAGEQAFAWIDVPRHCQRYLAQGSLQAELAGIAEALQVTPAGNTLSLTEIFDGLARERERNDHRIDLEGLTSYEEALALVSTVFPGWEGCASMFPISDISRVPWSATFPLPTPSEGEDEYFSTIIVNTRRGRDYTLTAALHEAAHAYQYFLVQQAKKAGKVSDEQFDRFRRNDNRIEPIAMLLELSILRAEGTGSTSMRAFNLEYYRGACQAQIELYALHRIAEMMQSRQELTDEEVTLVAIEVQNYAERVYAKYAPGTITGADDILADLQSGLNYIEGDIASSGSDLTDQLIEWFTTKIGPKWYRDDVGLKVYYYLMVEIAQIDHVPDILNRLEGILARHTPAGSSAE
ncbi:hypothetical protein AUK40_05790 [Candidatus Wirthbacteria bacterium CG2_30_54_11]|uniref:Uncharacterized protein n=1 Tax=Candidatus Wirthbacteria bacterium CG2_30_54_11 TaxID=1817892 RepID=A0A1J5IGA8_9BACT|nr:MAG: hypothetical protein AUK40_05790 [Candidatus Wirthbacteria bacterium CG2_30_54_11]